MYVVLNLHKVEIYLQPFSLLQLSIIFTKSDEEIFVLRACVFFKKHKSSVVYLNISF